MTLTIEVPEDVAARLAALSDAERQRIAVDALREATLNGNVPDEGEAGEPGSRPVTDVMALYGFAKGQPGSIGADVDGYLRRLRDEWEDRDADLRRDAA